MSEVQGRTIQHNIKVLLNDALLSSDFSSKPWGGAASHECSARAEHNDTQHCAP
jgi:hypothetical protein